MQNTSINKYFNCRVIQALFRIIRPTKTFFMAVDGVAPRAKMNQQRSRRFMSARNADKVDAEAKRRGEELPTEERFDSNTITPGLSSVYYCSVVY